MKDWGYTLILNEEDIRRDRLIPYGDRWRRGELKRICGSIWEIGKCIYTSIDIGIEAI